MRKSSIFILSAIVALSSCSKSPEEKADAFIRKELPKSLIKADSYEPVETKVDSAFAPYDSPEFHELLVETIKMWAEMEEYDRQAKDAKSYMSIFDSPYSSFSRTEHEEYKAEYEKYMKAYEDVKARLEKKTAILKEMQGKSPEFIGFKATHRYRANNNAGQTILGEMLYIFDKDISKVLVSYAMESQEYAAVQELIKRAKESKTD